MSAFSGLSTAISALQAHRRALDVAGQNIANANTEGYSRQRVDLKAAGGPPVPAIFSTWQDVGGGVSVTDVSRARDAFLEARGRAEHGQSAYLTATNQVYGFIENVLAEPSDTALQSQLSDFWAGWGDVGNTAGDPAARTQVLGRASVVTEGLRAAYGAVSSLWATTRTHLDVVAVEANTTASTLAQLNETIQRAHAAGLPVNELADQRDTHLMRLAELVGATTIARADATIDVYVAGSTLVSGTSSRNLIVTGARRLDDQATDPVTLRWADNDSQVTAGGQVAAGVETVGDILPGQAAGLDNVAARLAQIVNDQHRAGYGLDGGTDRPFFTGSTAATIGVALTDPRHVAASGVTGGGLGASNADAIAGLGDAGDGPDEAYRGMVVALGVVAQSAARRADIQARVTTELDAARAAGSGVSLDEEMTNMLASQRAYEAAARLITTIDGMLDVLINRTGLVGR